MSHNNDSSPPHPRQIGLFSLSLLGNTNKPTRMQLNLCSLLLLVHIFMISCGVVLSSFIVNTAKPLLLSSSSSSPSIIRGFWNDGFLNHNNHHDRKQSPSFLAHALNHDLDVGDTKHEETMVNEEQQQTRQQPPIHVWDNVVPLESRSLLHKEASASGLGHRVFRRGQPTPSNPIEQVLDDILQQIIPSSQPNNDDDNDELYVEYWARQEWRHIEAHADVDENLAKAQDDAFTTGTSIAERPDQNFKYPTKGHVLYLQVGSEVQGPTCLFPDRSSGGQLLKESNIASTYSSKGQEKNTNNPKEVELVTVPAVPGRLLRFEGNIVHAVPRPADLWLLLFTMGTPKFEPEEEWGRSVILFNTWSEPPLNVQQQEQQELKEDECEERPNICNAKETWKSLDIMNEETIMTPIINNDNKEDDDDDDNDDIPLEQKDAKTKSAKIWLLGNERRRNHMLRTVKLMAPEHIQSALTEKSQVRRTILEQP